MNEQNKEIELLKNRHFELNNSDMVILKRVKGLTVKPPLYIFDLTKHCYVSSLKTTQQKNQFIFDIRDKEKGNLNYNLFFDEKGKILVKLA